MSRLSVAATLLMAGALGCGVSAQAAAQPSAAPALAMPTRRTARGTAAAARVRCRGGTGLMSYRWRLPLRRRPRSLHSKQRLRF